MFLSGETPLHTAIRSGCSDIAKLLVDSGTSINTPDCLGKISIMTQNYIVTHTGWVDFNIF